MSVTAPPRRNIEDPVTALVLLAVTALGALLRLRHLGSVPGDPFYDAAVRSMGLSWHNFFFGAFEPGGSVSIDKPPVDLWLQVISVKLFGFSSFSLKLPEALAGTLASPLLFAAVRPVFGRIAGLGAAGALAVLPIEVITARSDTMDGLMMLLIVMAFYCCMRACRTGSVRWLLLGAVALGVAFNVKLLESVVPLPGLAVLIYLGLPWSHRRRLATLLAAAAVYVAVALSWLSATLLFPAHDRPFAIGSTNGSAWNAAFVFNGADRVSGTNAEGSTAIVYGSTKGFVTTTQVDRDHVPITAPSASRLLAKVGPLSGERLGLEVLAAVLLGGPALLCALFAGAGAVRRRDDAMIPKFDDDDEPVTTPDPDEGDDLHGAAEETAIGRLDRSSPPDREGGPELVEPFGGHAAERSASAHAMASATTVAERRLQRSVASGLLVWLVVGLALFSEQARLHPRYVEAFTPAVAAVLGAGVAWACTARRTWPRAWLVVSLALLAVYGERLVYGTTGPWTVMLAASVGGAAIAAVALLMPALRPHAWPGATAAILVLVGILSIPLNASLAAVRANTSDAGHVGALRPSELRIISDYLRAHQGNARYEVASASATAVGGLIEQDVRPVIVLTTYNARTLTTIPQLQALIRSGAVRYGFLNTACGRNTPSTDAACSPPARWIRTHGVDVSLKAGLPHRGVLWRLPKSVA